MQGVNFMYQYAPVCTNTHLNFTYQYAFFLSKIQSLQMSSELIVNYSENQGNSLYISVLESFV